MSEVMTEKQDESSLMGPGARLRIAREATRLTVNDVARYLHLKPEVINDIENDDYSRAPRAVFLRGYIRSYAKLLSLPGDDIIASLDRFYQEEELSEAAAKPAHRVYTDDKKVWVRWVSAIVAIVLVTFVAVWWHWQKVNRTEPQRLLDTPFMTEQIKRVEKEQPKQVSTAYTSDNAKRIVEVDREATADAHFEKQAQRDDLLPPKPASLQPKHQPVQVTQAQPSQTDDESSS